MADTFVRAATVHDRTRLLCPYFPGRIFTVQSVTFQLLLPVDQVFGGDLGCFQSRQLRNSLRGRFVARTTNLFMSVRALTITICSVFAVYPRPRLEIPSVRLDSPNTFETRNLGRITHARLAAIPKRLTINRVWACWYSGAMGGLNECDFP